MKNTSYRYVVQSRHIEDSDAWWNDQAGPWHATAEAAFKAIDATRKPKTRLYRVIKRTVTEEVIEREAQR